MTEEWRDIPGYEGLYQASDLGRVRSLDRVDTSGKRRRARLMRPSVRSDGCYFEVHLSKGNKGRTWPVHQLVARAFFGPPLEGREVCHGPAGSFDNSTANLRYGTSKDNSQDQVRDGTTVALKVIRDDGKRYNSLKEAAADNNCTPSLICLACKGKIETAKKRRFSYT